MKIKTSYLEGVALDWAVAKAVGHGVTFGQWGTLHYGAIVPQPVDLFPDQTVPFNPSTDWSQGGPLMGARIAQTHSYSDGAYFSCVERTNFKSMYGPTMLIAAMRAIVAAELGDEVEVPDELAALMPSSKPHHQAGEIPGKVSNGK